ncbi:gephyrin-like molybdotransferase Glp [Dinoroseobacter sp. S375]|uniref:molybdopterin molybdotransferase MoeA n=1 Tax=Dinoroseobacter sp. S375 TaxID=3415136 RepID=UPI003C799B4E
MNRPMRNPVCACDDPARTAALISVETAFARLGEAVRPLRDYEELRLTDASGRVLAAPVTARAALPPFDNAAMDGYALRAADLAGDGPWQLPVGARIAAGQWPEGPSGGAARIFTGAPLPAWADTVVMQEDVTRRDGGITLPERPPCGSHVRRAGEIAAQGTELAAAGQRLGPRQIASIAAAGHSTVRVSRRPRAALVITGDEIRSPDDPRDAAGIWDVNGPLLQTALNASGAEVSVHHAPDDRAATRSLLAGLAEEVDLIVTTGGISVGEEDHVRPAMDALGTRMAFAGVAIKPGKPVCSGQLGKAHWLGLPGNPVAAFVTWKLFGRHMMNRLQGIDKNTKLTERVRCAHPLQHRAGRAEYRLARIDRTAGPGAITVICPDSRSSGHITWLAQADGLICLPAPTGDIPAGTELAFLPFGPPD